MQVLLERGLWRYLTNLLSLLMQWPGFGARFQRQNRVIVAAHLKVNWFGEKLWKPKPLMHFSRPHSTKSCLYMVKKDSLFARVIMYFAELWSWRLTIYLELEIISLFYVDFTELFLFSWHVSSIFSERVQHEELSEFGILGELPPIQTLYTSG